MTTNWTVKLTYGARELNLNSGRYQPALGFVPPPVALSPLLATGTSANRYGGATKISERAETRTWSISIEVIGSSDAEIVKGMSDFAEFLALASTDPIKPLYLQVRQNSDVAFEPLWGQYGANKRYEIVHASPPAIDSEYSRGNMRDRRAYVSTTLTLKPYAVGLPQRFASGSGGVLEDTVGWADGNSRGLQVPEAVTNKMTNPIFGHGTWDNGWNSGAGITESEETDEKFTLFGKSSAKLVRTASGATWVQAINVGNTNTHTLSFYAKKADGSAVTTTDCRAYYSSGQAGTTFTAVGDDGWYRGEVEVTGINASTNTGIDIPTAGRTVYVDGFQLEEQGWASPLVYGDLMGCTWTGTAHASTSSRTQARARVAVSDSVSAAQGTWRVVWKADKASTELTGTRTLLEEDTGELALFYATGTTDWRVTDGTNTADSGAETFSAGDVLVFHFTYDPANGLILYKNGSSIATNATFTPPTIGTYLYIGTTDAVTQHINGTFMGVATFDRAMTAQEVSDDYTNISQLTADNDIIEPIPYIWTKDGDDAVDAVDGVVTGTAKDNWCILAGVPGNGPTELFIDATPSAGGASTQQVALSRFDMRHREFFLPKEVLFGDFDATADSGASSGDGYTQVTLTTAEQDFKWTVTLGNYTTRLASTILGRSYVPFARVYDAGSNAQAKAVITAAGEIGTSFRNLAAGASAFRLEQLPPITFPSELDFFGDQDLEVVSIAPQGTFKRTTGSAVFRVDYINFLARPVVVLELGGGTNFYYQGMRGRMAAGAATRSTAAITVKGDRLTVVPNRLNMITSLMGDSTVNPNVTWTLTYNRLEVTPRYYLL